ncbi:MAG: ribosome-binding ATPase YchF [Herpetosiphonaceae bacterium]|nr:MAG: ribosome-binding ATPase YchF [Herpetosiphonaceae bacterium]
MKIGIIGLPNSGKTTVFNALTRGTAETAAYSSGQLEPNLATVKVPDERLDVLAQMFRPKKVTPADVQYIDVAGLSGSARESGGLSPQFLNYISQVDALLHVVRAFEDESVPHLQGSVDPARDIQAVDLELAFSDMAIIERRLARLKGEIGKMPTKEREVRQQEHDLLERLYQGLEHDLPIRDQELSEEEARLIRGYQFLTAKPLLIVLNIGEEQLAHPPAIAYSHKKSATVALAGKIEAELAQMEEEDARLFMEDLGITEPARDRLIKKSYELLGLISFLTAGPDEVRAWTIKQGTPAVEAAGTIHSDIQRGFIRAEVVAYNDLVAAGGMAEAKKRGLVRLEGKSYTVQDGDICHFLFNV